MARIFSVSYDTLKLAIATGTKVYHYSTPDSLGYIAGTGNGDLVYSARITGSNVADFDSNYLADSTEVFEEDDVLAIPTLSTYNKASRYDVSDTIIYMGTAPAGSLDADAVWLIKKITMDVDGNPVDEKVSDSGVIWDDRAGLTYH